MDILSNVTTFIEQDQCRVDLIDCCPRICPPGRTCDFAIARSARASYAQDIKSIDEDNRLINYLLRNDHTSPFEFVNFTFKIRCPIFVARQIMRHRTFSFNEKSLRYVEAHDDEFYTPSLLRGVDNTISKQSSSTINIIDEPELLNKYNSCIRDCYAVYQSMLEHGVCREQSRMILPVSTLTTLYAQVDLKNLLHFLRLRMDEHTQLETRLIANAMYELISPLVPQTIKAFNDYKLHSITFTDKEITRKKELTKRELKEFEDKYVKLTSQQ